MAHTQTPIIGLIGGVGCGKSSVARWVAEHLRACVIDADAVGHEVLQRDDVKAAIRETFGDQVFRGDEIDRSQVADLVFGNSSENIAARQKLESIVHPSMRVMFEAQITAAIEADDVDLIVFDAAVLLEGGWADRMDVLVYVDVPYEERRRRISARRGWDEDELNRREASQWPIDRKRTAAHVVIDNSGPLDETGRQLETYLRDHGHLPAVTHQLSGNLAD